MYVILRVLSLSFSLSVSVTSVSDSDPQSKAYVVVQCLPFVAAVSMADFICDVTDICLHARYSSVYIYWLTVK
jgi:hypothetical protein